MISALVMATPPVAQLLLFLQWEMQQDKMDFYSLLFCAALLERLCIRNLPFLAVAYPKHGQRGTFHNIFPTVYRSRDPLKNKNITCHNAVIRF